MNATVKECINTRHSPELYELVPAENLSERRNRKGYYQKTQGHHARRPKKKFDRICAKLVIIGIPKQKRQRNEAVDENQEFVEFY